MWPAFGPELGAVDPHWSVLTEDRYRRGRLDEARAWPSASRAKGRCGG